MADMSRIEITVEPKARKARLLAPVGMATPHGTSRLETSFAKSHSCESGNTLAEFAVSDAPLTLVYALDPGTAPYPDAMFNALQSRFTRAAEALIENARAFKDTEDPARAIADQVASLFTYGHPDTAFYDDHDLIPQLCSLSVGSCVDINAYFIASLRAAGIKTGYITGYFFPEEKFDKVGNAWCDDMHCWVVTEDCFGTREWDIAHHLKMDQREIAPALNPKPGKRFGIAHSMGLTFPTLDLVDIKLISEPMWLAETGAERAALEIRLVA